MSEFTQLIHDLNTNDNTTRLTVIQKLGEMGNTQAVEALLPLLQDPSPAIRRETVLALRRINDERAFEAMIATLNDEDNSVRRRTSAWVMSMGQNSRLVVPLIALLSDEDARIPAREFAAMALGNIADVSAVDALATVLMTAPQELKRRITHSLSLIPDACAVGALAQMLNDEDIPTRKIAAKTLRKIATPEAIALLEANSTGEKD